MPFPATKPVIGMNGAMGLLIADEHDKPAHLRALNRNLRLLRTNIDVLYLEHFRASARDLEGASLATVLRLIQENKFEWYSEIADNFTAVLGNAKGVGLKVHGINIENPGKPHFVWRMSGVNDAIAAELKAQQPKDKFTRFGVFIGKDHARGLNKAGRLQGIACYIWDQSANKYVDL
jgi:hypothetical protein